MGTSRRMTVTNPCQKLPASGFRECSVAAIILQGLCCKQVDYDSKSVIFRGILIIGALKCCYLVLHFATKQYDSTCDLFLGGNWDVVR
jgi:hypothetical protein